MAQEPRKLRVRTKLYDTCPEDACLLLDEKHYNVLQYMSVNWNPQGYGVVSCPPTVMVVHRYIVEVLEGIAVRVDQVIHHKNSNKYDNRLENLEVTTQSHNVAAIDRKTRTSTSRYKGVVWFPRDQKWNANIRFGGRKYNLGYYIEEVEAAKAYDRAFTAVHRSTSGTNDLLSMEEANTIIREPTALVPRPKFESRGLPSLIVKCKADNGFIVHIARVGFKVTRTFRTLEQAIAFRNECLESIRQKKEAKKLGTDTRPIERNADGLAIIQVKILNSAEVAYAVVDDEMYHELVQKKWRLYQGYAITSEVRMHNAVLDWSDRVKVVDHINGNRLDNRRNNLRIVSQSFNARNCTKRKKTSQYRGVSWRDFLHPNQWCKYILGVFRQGGGRSGVLHEGVSKARNRGGARSQATQVVLEFAGSLLDRLSSPDR